MNLISKVCKCRTPNKHPSILITGWVSVLSVVQDNIQFTVLIEMDANVPKVLDHQRSSDIKNNLRSSKCATNYNYLPVVVSRRFAPFFYQFDFMYISRVNRNSLCTPTGPYGNALNKYPFFSSNLSKPTPRAIFVYS